MNLTFGVPGLLGGIKFALIKIGEQKVKKLQSKIGATTWRNCETIFFEEYECESSNRGYRSFRKALEIMGINSISLDRYGVLEQNFLS